jgi:flagellar basal body-associated protein FliL
MAVAQAVETSQDGAPAGSKKKLILLAVPLVLAAAGGAFFLELIPSMGQEARRPQPPRRR